MEFNLNCLTCNIQQVQKIFEIHPISDSRKEEAIRKVLRYLSEKDYGVSVPEMMKGTFQIATDSSGVSDPYEEIRSYYNLQLLELYDDFKAIVAKSSDDLYSALKIAVVGNIIDFGANHSFDKENVVREILEYSRGELEIDHSDELFDKLSGAKTLMYIGDNCGEIVLDKLFIEEIKKHYPDLEVYFCVRGEPILNDVTAKDAAQVKMEEVAKVIDDGNGVPGAVLSKSTDEFKAVFEKSDVIIAKGQGNYEGLNDVERDGLFFLLLAKCSHLADVIGVEQMKAVCVCNYN